MQKRFPAHGRPPARLGMLADRMSVNIEMPSQNSLKPSHRISPKLRTGADGVYPQPYARKHKGARHLQACAKICARGAEYADDSRRIPGNGFADTKPDGRAVPEIPAQTGVFLRYPGGGKFSAAFDRYKAAALREHRLYQADWLLRFY